MPHHVDIDSIHQNIFLLLNICYGAKTFAQEHDLESDDAAKPIGSTFYSGWLKFSLSEKLIDTAIKTRIILDMVQAEEKQYEAHSERHMVNTRELDRKISEQYNIGYFTEDNVPVNLRESCNKIIHALDIQYIHESGEEEHDLDEESEDKREWWYWEGVVGLTGHVNNKEWYLTLHIAEFCLALEELISHLESSVDWQTLHNDYG